MGVPKLDLERDDAAVYTVGMSLSTKGSCFTGVFLRRAGVDSEVLVPGDKCLVLPQEALATGLFALDGIQIFVQSNKVRRKYS